MAKTKQSEDPNKDLDLSGIDYENLTGENWQKYQEVTKGLMLREKYDFEIWKASSIVEYEEDRTSPTPRKIAVMVGIRLNGNKPIQKTRVKWSDAQTMNAQVSHNAADAGTSKYYLLVKPQA